MPYVGTAYIRPDKDRAALIAQVEAQGTLLPVMVELAKRVDQEMEWVPDGDKVFVQVEVEYFKK